MADALPVRLVNDKWQVRFDNPERWLDIADDAAALAVAEAAMLASQVTRGEAGGEPIAGRLDKAAAAVNAAVGECAATRYFRTAARQARIVG